MHLFHAAPCTEDGPQSLPLVRQALSRSAADHQTNGVAANLVQPAMPGSVLLGDSPAKLKIYS